jgi:hypothetical protein
LAWSLLLCILYRNIFNKVFYMGWIMGISKQLVTWAQGLSRPRGMPVVAVASAPKACQQLPVSQALLAKIAHRYGLQDELPTWVSQASQAHFKDQVYHAFQTKAYPKGLHLRLLKPLAQRVVCQLARDVSTQAALGRRPQPLAPLEQKPGPLPEA